MDGTRGDVEGFAKNQLEENMRQFAHSVDAAIVACRACTKAVKDEESPSTVEACFQRAKKAKGAVIANQDLRFHNKKTDLDPAVVKQIKKLATHTLYADTKFAPNFANHATCPIISQVPQTGDKKWRAYCNVCDTGEGKLGDMTKKGAKQVDVKGHMLSQAHLERLALLMQALQTPSANDPKILSKIQTRLDLIERCILSFTLECARDAQPFTATERSLKLQQRSINTILNGKLVSKNQISDVDKAGFKEVAAVLRNLNAMAEHKPVYTTKKGAAMSTQTAERAASSMTLKVLTLGQDIAKLKVLSAAEPQSVVLITEHSKTKVSRAVWIKCGVGGKSVPVC